MYEANPINRQATVIYNNRLEHVSKLLTGFRMLEDNGLIQITYIENKNNRYHLPDGPIVELRIDDKRIAFDAGDRWELCHNYGKEYLKQVDCYFARGYSTKVDIVTPEIFLDNPKVQPLGLCYYVTYPGNPIDKRPGIKNQAKRIVKHLTGFYKMYYPSAFEYDVDNKTEDLTIIFMTRLWGTKEFEDLLRSDISQEARDYIMYMCEERDKINHQRIEIIRALKNKYNSSFIGGVQNDSVSQALCPDLIVPREETNKKIYMMKMKSSDICIGTMGLHRSIGFKVGEYVAASKAIVTDRLEYIVPGNFEEGKNYLSFQSVDECIHAVDYLYNRPQLVCAMKQANADYYREYVHPEKQLLNALKIAGVDLK